MNRPQPGGKVLIIEDCRDNGCATGQVGTYETDIPLIDEDPDSITTPQIRLGDGTVILGLECWWQPMDDVSSLEESQEQLKQLQQFLREKIADQEDHDS